MTQPTPALGRGNLGLGAMDFGTKVDRAIGWWG